MQQRNEAELLSDILRHIDLAEEYLTSAETFATERMSRCAVERCLQIVGEAVTQLLALEVDYLRFISDARRIIAFRHLLTHHYYRVSPILLHEIVTRSLPKLKRETIRLLDKGLSDEDDDIAE